MKEVPGGSTEANSPRPADPPDTTASVSHQGGSAILREEEGRRMTGPPLGASLVDPLEPLTNEQS